MGNALIAAITGNISTFTSGTFISWSSFEINKLSDANETTLDTPLDKEEQAWVTSSLSLGAICGPFLFAYLAPRIGRKYTILSIGPLLFLAAILIAFSKTVELLYLARFISGIGGGGLFAVFPNYIAEIADSHNRGAINSVVNIASGAGLLFSYSVGPFLNITIFNCILAIFPILFIILFFITGVESPYYYVQKKQYNLAREALQKLRGPDVKIEEELNMIQQKIQEVGNGSFFDIFKSRGLTTAFIVCVGLLAFQQLCGMNAVMFFSQNIFEDAKVSLKPEICAIILGIVMVVSNVSIPLTVDRLGRKMVLLISASGMVVSEAVLGTYYYLKDNNTDVSSISFIPIVFLTIFVVFYTIGYASTPWVYLGEIFPPNVKSIATSVISTICWIIGFFSTKYFASMVDAFGMGICFWIFAVVCTISIPFSQLLVLETKGKTLHEIQDLLGSS